MFTKNYIHRNSACPQRASPEWPRDQCVGTMWCGSGGIQALRSGCWHGPGVSHGAGRGLGPGAGNPSPRHGGAQPGRDGVGVWSTVTGPSSGGLVQMCSVQDPRADPELSADQADPRGQSRGQAAGHAEAHSRSLSHACSRDARAVAGQDR